MSYGCTILTMGTCLTRARSTENSDELPWHLPFVVNATCQKNTSQLACQTSATFFPLLAANHRDAKPRRLQWRSATVGVRLDGENTLAFIQQNPVQLERRILSPPQSSHLLRQKQEYQKGTAIPDQLCSLLEGSLFFCLL